MLSEIARFQHYLRRKYPNSSTSIHYISDLELFFGWLSKPVNAVVLQDVDTYIEHCQKQGHRSNTINRRLAALRCLYTFLEIDQEGAPTNPVIPKRHFIRRGRSLPRDVRDEDIARLFAVIDQPRDKAMFMLMLRCGLRVGEVRNLSMSHLYLHSNMGRLPRLLINGKGSVQRSAYLSSQVYAALVGWLARRPTVQSQAVFLNKFGKRISVTGIQSRLAKYCQQTGIWITCHQLRHTFGRHLTEARLPVTSIQKLMGHAQLRSTEVYIHISDAQVQQDYETAINRVTRRLGREQAS
jgi:site-specific recombinase XerC